MKIKEVTIDGITYTVRSTTYAGLKDAIKQFKKAVKKRKEESKPKNTGEQGYEQL